MKEWVKREEELFTEAWNSGSYGRKDLARIFQRSWDSLKHKASSLELTSMYIIEARVRVESIEKALQEDHVI